MLQYILEVTLCWTLFYGIFFALLRKVTFYRVNRWYLLGALVAGILIPLLSFIDLDLHQEQVAQAAPLVYVVKEAPAYIANTVIEQTIDWQYITQYSFLGLYLLGLTFFLIRFLKGLTTIYSLYNGGSKTHHDHHTVVNTSQPHLPFSFLNKIFISQKLPLKGEIDDILRHELAHVRGHHSLDVLLLEIINIIFWFHPLVYLYKTAIRQTHEYLADAVVLESTSRKIYGNILLKQSLSGLEVALAHHFFHSHIKKRINMMYQKKSGQSAWLKYSLALPILILLFVVFSGYQSQNAYTTDDLIKEWQIDCEGSFSAFPTKIYADIEEYKSKADYLREYTFTEGFVEVINNYDPKHFFLIVFDGEVVTDNLSDFISLDRDITAESMTILRKKIATEKYGDLGKNGALEFITSKQSSEDNTYINNTITFYDGEPRFFASPEEETKFKSQYNSIEILTENSRIERLIGHTSEAQILSNYFYNSSGQTIRINGKETMFHGAESLPWYFKPDNNENNINIKIENRDGLLHPIFKYHGDEDLNAFTITTSKGSCDNEAMMNLFSYIDETDQTKIPLIFIEDKEITLPLSNYIASTKNLEIETIEWICPVPAMEGYGERGKNGVVKLYGISQEQVTEIENSLANSQIEYNRFRKPPHTSFNIDKIYTMRPFEEIRIFDLGVGKIPKGLLSVNAGNIELKEGKDHTVDYSTGEIRITNPEYLEKVTAISIQLKNKKLTATDFIYNYVKDVPLINNAKTFEESESIIRKYIKENIKVPSVRPKGKYYTFDHAMFIVEKDGSISDMKTSVIGQLPSVQKEALRVVQKMSDELGWQPGRNNGEVKRVGHIVPVQFFWPKNKGDEKTNTFPSVKNFNKPKTDSNFSDSALIIINGEIKGIGYDWQIESHASDKISKFEFLADEDAIEKYGQLAKHGAYKLTTESANLDPLSIIDNNIRLRSSELPFNLEESDIEKIEIIKDDKALELYKDEGRNGVHLVTTKGRFMAKENSKITPATAYRKIAQPGERIIDLNCIGSEVGPFDLFKAIERSKFRIVKLRSETNSFDLLKKTNQSNIIKESVVVTANNFLLKENIDYTVDFNTGILNIINSTYKNKDNLITVTFVYKNNNGEAINRESKGNSQSTLTMTDKNGNKVIGKADKIALSIQNDTLPLIVIDDIVKGKISKPAIDLKAENIKHINVLKGEAAIKKYGDEASNGVVEIQTKEYQKKINYDTLIVYNPETFEETVTVVPATPSFFITDTIIGSGIDTVIVFDADTFEETVSVTPVIDAVNHYSFDPDNNKVVIRTVRSPYQEDLITELTFDEFLNSRSKEDKVHGAMVSTIISHRYGTKNKSPHYNQDKSIKLKAYQQNSSQLNISYSSSYSEDVTFYVYDLLGKLLHKKSLSSNAAQSDYQVELSNVNTSVVIVMSQQGDKIRSEKVLIAK